MEQKINLLDLLPYQEHRMAMIYGRVGNGKTAYSTIVALELLMSGAVVYTNWPIVWDGYDQRDYLWFNLLGLCGLKKNFLRYPKENLHSIKIDENFHSVFAKITDATVMLDEGHVVFDSYQMAKMSLEQRSAVLHTRHYGRSIFVISQRFTAIHAVLRENVSEFYRVRKVWTWPWTIFRVDMFDLKGSGDVDEENSLWHRWFTLSKVRGRYDTAYLREGTPDSQRHLIEVHEETIKSSFARLLRLTGARGGALNDE